MKNIYMATTLSVGVIALAAYMIWYSYINLTAPVAAGFITIFASAIAFVVWLMALVWMPGGVVWTPAEIDTDDEEEWE